MTVISCLEVFTVWPSGSRLAMRDQRSRTVSLKAATTKRRWSSSITSKEENGGNAPRLGAAIRSTRQPSIALAGAHRRQVDLTCIVS